MQISHGNSLTPTRIRSTEFRWGERTYVMGILNLSPDSFSGDGLGDNWPAVIARARQMETDGADIIDVGGESTRPGSKPIPVEDELFLMIPAIEKLLYAVSVPISIDTYKSKVAEQALKAGANMINDVWGLKYDPQLAEVVARAGTPLVLMSNQRDAPGHYDIMAEVISSLKRSLRLAEEAGITANNIIIDPGIGFGKSMEENMLLISRLGDLKVLGKPILLGTSRKFAARQGPAKRLEATSATTATGVANGADIIRVHDVKEMVALARQSDAAFRKAVK